MEFKIEENNVLFRREFVVFVRGISLFIHLIVNSVWLVLIMISGITSSSAIEA